MNNQTVRIHQLSSTIGDVRHNQETMAEHYFGHCAVLHLFPDLFISGFPLCALAQDGNFIKSCETHVHKIIATTQHKKDAIIFSAPAAICDGHYTSNIILAANGEAEIIATRKHYLSHEDGTPVVARIKIADMTFGLWCGKPSDNIIDDLLDVDHIVMMHNVRYGPTFLQDIYALFAASKRCSTPMHYINQTGVCNHYLYPGFSFTGNNLLAFEDVDGAAHRRYSQDEADYTSAMIALRHYYKQHGFKGITIGVSGGIDSALSLIIAVDAIGAKNIHALIMPSRHNAQANMIEAEEYCERTGVRSTMISIDGIHHLLEHTIGGFCDISKGNTDENLQSRIRGILLMALSNSQGSLLLNCGNKTEVLLGYCTLYGDTCGGFGAISDLYKTDIYRLASWRNNNIPRHACDSIHRPIPQSFIDRVPSAELRKNQRDEDDLPLGNYAKIDRVLKKLIDQNMGIKEIKKEFDTSDHEHIEALYRRVISNEHKRRQMCIGVLITSEQIKRYPIPCGAISYEKDRV